MEEKSTAVVYDCELSALRESRKRMSPMYHASNGSRTVWIVANSEHQALLALTAHVWPIVKVQKRDRDNRYLELLEELSERTVDGTRGQEESLQSGGETSE